MFERLGEVSQLGEVFERLGEVSQLGEVFERLGEVCNFAASKSKFKTFIHPASIQSMKFKTSG
ncbi:MAG: hypothetical protein ACTHJ5_13255 [Ilyomonas sp.]